MMPLLFPRTVQSWFCNLSTAGGPVYRRRTRVPAWVGIFCTACMGFASGALMTLKATDWPTWRGPTRDGRTTEPRLLKQWPKDGPKVLWKAKVGLGFSAFAVSGDRAFTTGHAEEQDTVFALDPRTGAVAWKFSYPAELGDKFFEGGTTGTPVLDGGQVYSLNRWGELICFQARDGAVVWRTNVVALSGARVPDWGFGGAPLVLGDRLILNVGDAGLALDKRTGAVLWKSEGLSAGYSTPFPVRRGDTAFVILGSAKAYVAVQATDGKEAWRIRWLTEYGVNASDPIVEGDKLFLSTGYGKGAALFEWRDGEPRQVWKSKVLRSQLNTSVLRDGFLYGVDGDTTEKASLKCVELATGQERWAVPNFGSGGVLLVGDQLLALSGTGELMQATATPERFGGELRAQVLGGKCWTAPVLADGRLFLKNSRGDVVCLSMVSE